MRLQRTGRVLIVLFGVCQTEKGGTHPDYNVIKVNFVAFQGCAVCTAHSGLHSKH
jgi:hypothetical protein